METIAGAASRSTLIAAVVLVVAALAGTSAEAKSVNSEYVCQVEVRDPVTDEMRTLDSSARASFDTGVPDGLVVEVGEKVSLEPFTGTITIPEVTLDFVGFVTLGGSPGGGFGNGSLGVFGADDLFLTEFSYEATPVPAEGPVSVDVEGTVERVDPQDDARFQPQNPGSYTITQDSFRLELDGGIDPRAFMQCSGFNGRVEIDTLEAVEVVTPTTTATPVRPVVVQTDFAEQEAGFPSLIGVGAFMTLLAGAGCVARARAHRASRRH